MNNITTQVWTYTLSSGSLTISADMGLTYISIMLISGSGTITGALTVNGIASSALSLQSNIPITLPSKGNYPIDGYIIDGTSGSVQIIAY